MKLRRTAHAAALAVVVAALSACGGSSEDAATSDAVGWDAAEPCSLADDATLAPLLTAGAGEGTATDSPERRACAWGKPEALNTVTVTTTSAPEPVDALRTIDVGGLEGRALAESKYQCILEVTTDAGTLSIESKFGLDATANPDTSCDRSVPLAEHALSRLKWA
ncbi:hypothetical protein [Rhodococcus sp. T2V]|uniref:hypothetical protein n=1 Tax=Rhodococcus sp. T2V TaxID=3034164 RepID=UPI0023E0D67E|nr:hypothetical protein [Rhodococcus sp. T2V]MDF3305081.1 hypothetical protein [Rhodococcus sp. T2V]